ncbi:restriction endonuclease subunit S [Lactobacillus helveticus]|uniref:restriction endonuclease subunit S n=1 Tax=Lactobacillus helveticus TaxID=1587 RepID=UPI00156388DE|nr:restriction endonuclease subunit S [Lactobacillus helveticus]NRO45038.1 Type-1 restriction enzyme EcoKI specificity protein [Lactobacillus helveticus]
MKDNQAKYPQLRFKGFTDPWEQRKLTDLATTYIGLVTTMTENYTTEGTLLIRNSDIKEGRFDLSNPIYLEKQFAEKNKTRRMKKGDVVTVHTGDIGTSAIINSELDGTIGFATITTRPKKELDSNFLAWYFNSNYHKKYAKRMSTGDGRSNYNMKDFNKNVIPTPKIAEQQKIGSFFKQLDETLTLHQRKLAKLKELKQGYLQKLFPKNGSKFPQLRFAGFADDWEERKLGELSNIVGGGTPSTSNPEYWDGDIDWYAPAEIGEQSYVSKSKKTITELGLKKSSARILPVGTVLFTSRAGIGNTAILAKEATTNQGFQSIVPVQNKLDSYFIFSRTNELKRYGEVTGAGSTFVEVSGKQMSKMSIMVPELSEQQKIGSFFKQLDDTIALHQRKLEKLQELKKGYLQKMFC